MAKEDGIDLAAGIYLHKKVGEAVLPGETLATVYANDREKAERAAEEIRQGAYMAFGKKERRSRPLILQVVGTELKF